MHYLPPLFSIAVKFGAMSEVVESNELHDVLFFLSEFEACFSSIDDVSFLSPHSSQDLHTWPCVFPDLDFVNGIPGAGDLWSHDFNYGMNGDDSADSVSSEVERQLKASVMELERRKASQHHTIHESCMAAQIEEKPAGRVVQFQTRTENEVLDDGYRWRKYGKKNIKNRYYPRSYYRCAESQNGCTVRKHVERCSNDPSILLTTYEGRHNHVASITEASFFL